jgi:hypothetical protein
VSKALHLFRATLPLLLAAFVCATLPGAARGQDEMVSAGFLNPFPPGDVYGLVVVGDQLADGLAGGLTESLGSDTRVSVQRRPFELDSLLRSDFDKKLADLEAALARLKPSIAVVIVGTEDRIPVRTTTGKRLAVGSDEWRAELGRRVELTARLFRRLAIAVYWVGLPTLRRPDANEDAQLINAIIREKGYASGVRYIDVYASFADEDGAYSSRGPDVTGQLAQLRSADGIGFTASGNRKLAHFVDREVRRDLTQARNDRNIPLAGNEQEQTRVGPERQAKAARPLRADGAAASMAAGDGGGGPSGMGAGDQKADNGRIGFKVAAANGREELVTVEILRPAIPASVVAAVTRKESDDKPAQMGDSLAEQAPGGLTLLNSITPASGAGGRRKLAPTQSPYFRVLVKGERLAARPGRVDDLTWPPPPPPPIEEAREPEPAPATAPARATQPPRKGIRPRG